MRSEVLLGWSGVPLYIEKGNGDSQTGYKQSSHLDGDVFGVFFVNMSKSCSDFKMNLNGFIVRRVRGGGAQLIGTYAFSSSKAKSSCH